MIETEWTDGRAHWMETKSVPPLKRVSSHQTLQNHRSLCSRWSQLFTICRCKTAQCGNSAIIKTIIQRSTIKFIMISVWLMKTKYGFYTVFMWVLMLNREKLVCGLLLRHENRFYFVTPLPVILPTAVFKKIEWVLKTSRLFLRWGGGCRTAFLHRGRQNQHKIKARRRFNWFSYCVVISWLTQSYLHWYDNYLIDYLSHFKSKNKSLVSDSQCENLPLPLFSASVNWSEQYVGHCLPSSNQQLI